MKKLILVVICFVMVFAGCLGHHKGVIVMDDGAKIKFNSYVRYDERCYFVEGSGVLYIIDKKLIKEMRFEDNGKLPQ